MADLLLATAAEIPPEYDESAALNSAFAGLGINAEWAVWDDPAVDWGRVPLVLVRTTWDYAHRRDDFLAWAERVGRQTTLLNPPDVLRWNTHKSYLVDLAEAGVPVVPTRLLPAGARVRVDEPSVVKPAVGVGGRGLFVLSAGDVAAAGDDEAVLQPLVTSVRTEGETSVFVLEGEPVAAVVKLPVDGEVRVHEEYGGSAAATRLTEMLHQVAGDVVCAAEKLLGQRLAYARVDLMRLGAGWVVSELELVEPGLYLDAVPHVAHEYAVTMSRRLSAGTSVSTPLPVAARWDNVAG